MRLKLFNKYYEKITRMANRIDYDVTKKYFMSKKNVYGIDNELNLVEHIQKTLNAIYKHPLMLKVGVLSISTLQLITKDLRFLSPKTSAAATDQGEIHNILQP